MDYNLTDCLKITYSTELSAAMLLLELKWLEHNWINPCVNQQKNN